MKLTTTLFLAATVSSQAAVVYFDLSPAGTDFAVGLSPTNEVPAVTNSTGSGNAISGGIAFDTDSGVFQLAVGYGSAAGFTDLTGAASNMHIHGPGGPGTNAGVLVPLLPYHFTAADPTKGGVIYGNILFPTNGVADLLAGLTYLNIHTATNPGGEIRGQLIPLVVTNAPPSVICPSNSTVECGTEATVTVVVSDPDGDALSVVWSLNGLPVRTNLIAAGQPPTSTNVTVSGELPLGTNLVGVVVSDSANNTAACSTTVTVVDATPPVITTLTAVPNTLWPPNHKMIDVVLRATVRDACGPVRWKITRVSSNERINGLGDGNAAPDWQITGDHTVKLRAERSGLGGGRVYTITAVATDAAGNRSTTKTVAVSVAHSQGK